MGDKKKTFMFVRLVSAAGTGFFYVKRKSAKKVLEKLEFRKYDPRVNRHVLFTEAKMKWHTLSDFFCSSTLDSWISSILLLFLWTMLNLVELNKYFFCGCCVFFLFDCSLLHTEICCYKYLMVSWISLIMFFRCGYDAVIMYCILYLLYFAARWQFFHIGSYWPSLPSEDSILKVFCKWKILV